MEYFGFHRKPRLTAGELMLLERMEELHKMMVKIMSAEDDLDAEVVDLASKVASVAGLVQELIAEIAAANTSNDPRIEAAVTRLRALGDTLNALSGPQPAPVPVPEPASEPTKTTS
jgi:hypothetical protein